MSECTHTPHSELEAVSTLFDKLHPYSRERRRKEKEEEEEEEEEEEDKERKKKAY